MSWLVPRNQLTVDQLRAIEMNAETHRVVVGSPRTGKTNVMLYRARYFSEKFSVPWKRYRIFVASTAQKDYLRPALKTMKIPVSSVTTLNDWYRKINRSYSEEILKESQSFLEIFSSSFDRWGKELGIFDEDELETFRKRSGFDEWCDHFYNNQIVRHLKQNNRLGKLKNRSDMVKMLSKSKFLYDLVLVDDGQDLEESDYKILNAAAAHVTVFMDEKQKLLSKAVGEKEVLKSLGLQRPNVNLLEVHGSPAHLAPTAAMFLKNESERAAFIEQPHIEKGPRQQPLLYLAQDETDEIDRLVDVVRDCVNNMDRIAILFKEPYHKQQILFTSNNRLKYAIGLQNAGIEVDQLMSGENG